LSLERGILLTGGIGSVTPAPSAREIAAGLGLYASHCGGAALGECPSSAVVRFRIRVERWIPEEDGVDDGEEEVDEGEEEVAGRAVTRAYVPVGSMSIILESASSHVFQLNY